MDASPPSHSIASTFSPTNTTNTLPTSKAIQLPPLIVPAKRPHVDEISIIDSNGLAFDSPVFTLFGGPERHHFAAHQSYLSQSPVFARLCSSDFKEAETGVIVLPEDTAPEIGCLLSWLYTGAFNRAESVGFDPNSFGALKHLGNMYIVGGKYQLKDLQDYVLSRLKEHEYAQKFPAQFIDVAYHVYGNIPESDLCFRTYFARVLVRRIRVAPDLPMEKLLGLAMKGGVFAKDLVKALCHVIRWSNVEGATRATDFSEITSTFDYFGTRRDIGA